MTLAWPDADRPMSREEYRRWYDAQPRGRFERIDGRVVAMGPETGAHLRCKAAVYKALDRAILAAGVPCQALPDGATVETDDGDYEPDALVNCGAPMADDASTAPNPVVIVEVLPLGPTIADTQERLPGYFQVPSVAHYLIAHPTRTQIIHHRRAGERIETMILVSGPIILDPPGIVVTIEEIYGG